MGTGITLSYLYKYEKALQDPEFAEYRPRNILSAVTDLEASKIEEPTRKFIQKQHTDIPWYQMKAMRNILIHEYFGIDIDVLWQTVKEDLPPLKAYLKKVLNS